MSSMLPVLCLAAVVGAATLTPLPAAAQESSADWRAEFEAVCSRTDAAMSLGDEELAALVSRCDALEARLAAESEVVRRVFGRRLKACRSLFVYVLESRQAGAGSAAVEGDAGAPSASPPPAPAAAPAAAPPASP